MDSSRHADVAFQRLAVLSARIREGAVSPVALVERCLSRIRAFNPALNAFITITDDLARDQAHLAASEIAAGRWRGPLHGVPVAVKDFYDTAGIRTTAAFEHFQERVPQRNADLVSALHEAGAVLVGKTNMHKLGMGTTSLDSHFGPVVNPRSARHVAGGSSGGSAVAVAAGLCYLTVDTDAIGSGRLPAAVCGVTCHKPTFGLLSSAGILAGEPPDPAILTLGHPCVTARTAEDVAVALHAIVAASTGGDTLAEAPRASLQNRRIGVITNYAADETVRADFAIACATQASMGVTLIEIEAPFGTATFDLRQVDQDREAINASLFGEVSAVILPTLTTRAPTVDEARAQGDMAVSPQNTFFCNYFGLPAVSVPSGLDETGMPVAVQIVGPQGADSAILALAREFERASGWKSEPPPMARPGQEVPVH